MRRSPTFAELRTAVTDRTIQTAFRTGWQVDYPSMFNCLGPIYGTDAGSNDGDYSNPEFDALLDEGLAATEVEAGIEKFQQAQEILFEDLPAIPLWYTNATGAWGEQVDNVRVRLGQLCRSTTRSPRASNSRSGAPRG